MTNTYQILDWPKWPQIHAEISEILSAQAMPIEHDIYHLDDWHYDEPDRFRTIRPLVDAMSRQGWMQSWKTTSVVVSYEQGIGLHHDSGNCDFSVVLPIKNTQNTYTIFYDVDQQPEKKTLQKGPATWWAYPPGNYQELDRVEVLRPTLINIKTPHSVVVRNNQVPRITLSLRLTSI